jgi:methylated-DNA-[protein]-cysteine S-methyltransferase
MNYGFVETPIGRLLVAGDEAIREIRFPQRAQGPKPGWAESARGAVGEALRQLRQYFDGRRTEFDLPLDPDGTSFQRQVWRQVQEIPYGSTISYAELARRAGNPRACRAVGGANGRNPIPIVIPCHRVIAADGTLGGFGGGLRIKRMLLELEGGALSGRAATV